MRLYEHGVEVAPGDSWSPGGLRLIATTELDVYAHFTMTIVDEAGRSLNERIVGLDQSPGPRRRADYYEESDLRNGLLAMAYHLERMATLYRQVAGLFEHRHPEQSTFRGNTHCPPIFYEADAFLTAAQRWYETLRRLMWKHYGRSDRPRSFRRLLECTDVLPKDHALALKDSWEAHGASMNQYRNSIAHYDPLDDGGKTAWVHRFNGRWGVTVKLPANPHVRSRAAFNFDDGPDVMTYAHGLLCHLTALAEATDRLPAIAAHRNRPYGSTPRGGPAQA